MQNVKYEVKGETLTITVNLKERHGLSTSGATVAIAGTQGNVKIGVGDISFGLSVYTKEGLDKLQLESAKAKGYKTWLEYQAALKAAKGVATPPAA